MAKKPVLTVNEMRVLLAASSSTNGDDLPNMCPTLEMSERKANQIWKSAMVKLNELIKIKSTKKIIPPNRHRYTLLDKPKTHQP